MNCPYCNSQVPDGAQYCPVCDSPVISTPPQEQGAPPPPQHGQYASSETPRLYNPNAAAAWSILLTPVFGSWCIYTNYKELGEKSRAQTSLAVTIVIAAVTVFVPLLTLFSSRLAVLRGAPFVALILWYVIEAKGQINFIETRGIVYELKPWVAPLLIGVLSATLYLGFMFFVCALWPVRYEYKTVAVKPSPQGNEFKANEFQANEFSLESELNANQNWELVSAVPEIETVHPNFGRQDLVPGIKPNTRTRRIILVFRKRKLF